MRILLVVILFLVAACGTLPCADCEGIRTTITLREDETFDRESGNPLPSKGNTLSS